MCYKKLTSFILIFAVVLVLVKGSCLEYGHSCWGAHGKRSGIAAGLNNFHPKPIHSNVAANRIDDMKLLAETIDNRGDSNKQHAPFDSFDEILSSSEISQGDPRPKADGALKLKNILRQQLQESLKYRKGRLQHLAASQLNADLRHVASSEQHEQQQQQQPQQLNDQWLQLPILNMKYEAKANAADDALTRQADDEGIFYDFN